MLFMCSHIKRIGLFSVVFSNGVVGHIVVPAFILCIMATRRQIPRFEV